MDNDTRIPSTPPPADAIRRKCCRGMAWGFALLSTAALAWTGGCSHGRTETEHGDRYYTRGRLAGAARHYDRALEQDPGDAAAWRGRGNVHAEKKESGPALDCYRRAQELAPQAPEGYYLEGVLHQEQGDADAAIAAYGKAIACPGDYWSARFNRGGLLLDKGDPAGALADFDAALALRRGEWRLHVLRGRTLVALERWAEAEEEMDKALALGAPPEVWRDRAGIRLDRGDWEGALSDAEKVLAAQPDVLNLNNMAWLLLTLPREDLRDTARARKLMDRARAMERKNNCVICADILDGTQAALAFAEGDPDRAIALLQALVDAGTAEPGELLQLECYRQGLPFYLSASPAATP